MNPRHSFGYISQIIPTYQPNSHTAGPACMAARRRRERYRQRGAAHLHRRPSPSRCRSGSAPARWWRCPWWKRASCGRGCSGSRWWHTPVVRSRLPWLKCQLRSANAGKYSVRNRATAAVLCGYIRFLVVSLSGRESVLPKPKGSCLCCLLAKASW